MRPAPEPVRRWLVALALGLAAPAWAAEPFFEAEGRVVRVDHRQGLVTLEHGEIPDLTGAGRTDFRVESPEMTRRVRPGDAVRFALVVPPSSHGLLALARLEPIVPAASIEPGPVSAGWDVPLSVLLTLWGVALGLVAGIGYVLWRTLGDMRQDLAAVKQEHQVLRHQLHLVAEALGELTELASRTRLPELARRVHALAAGRPGNGRPDAPPADPAIQLIAVRRGEQDLYRVLQERFEPAGVAVIWDRRGMERRRAPGAGADPGSPGRPEDNRRHGERRGPPPPTWDPLGFVLAPGPIGSAGPGGPPGVVTHHAQGGPAGGAGFLTLPAEAQ